MPSYKTIAQILIATSVAGSALAAPATAQEMHDARDDLSQLERRMSDSSKTLLKTAPAVGLLAGTIWGLAGTAGKFINSVVPQYNYGTGKFQQQRSVETDPISRGLAGLSDDDLQMLSYMSRRALESLD